jgi:hypothetical protein
MLCAAYGFEIDAADMGSSGIGEAGGKRLKIGNRRRFRKHGGD